jgi:hypothetical protein
LETNYSEIQEKGMSTELDERANKFLVNCRTKTDIETQSLSPLF